MRNFLVKLYKKRILEIVEPSEEIKDSYLKKSESNLLSSKILLKSNMLEESVALTYFSMYNAVLALLFRTGIKCENHIAVAELLKKIFDRDNSDFVKAKRERIDKQYYTDFKITKKEVEEGIVSAENFNRELKGFISGLNNSKIKLYREGFMDLMMSNKK